MRKTPKSIHISAIVLNSVLLLISAIYLFLLYSFITKLVSDAHSSSSADEQYVIQFVTRYIWLFLIMSALGIATLVIDILGAVSAFKEKNNTIGILYILGIFLTPIISIVAGGLALRNLNKNKTNNGNDQTLNNIHLQAPEL